MYQLTLRRMIHACTHEVYVNLGVVVAIAEDKCVAKVRMAANFASRLLFVSRLE